MIHCSGCGDQAQLSAGATECCGEPLCEAVHMGCWTLSYATAGVLGEVVGRVKACCVGKAQQQARIIHWDLRVGPKVY